MAEAILYGVTQTIIERLGSSTLQQIGSIWGVKAEFKKMTNTVSTIQAVLQDAEEQQVNNHQVRDWLMKLRDAVFDADDLLSEFSTHVLRQRVMGVDKMPKKRSPTASSKHCGGLAELNKLDLRGRLEINNLAWVKDATSETKAANLKEKKHLTDLVLRWNPRDDDEISLNGLQPHQSLKYLSVGGYGGVRFSHWLSTLTNLAKLSVYDCKKCQHFPPLYQLPYLRELYISDMLGLEYMSDRNITDEISASLASSSTTFFPSLESLYLSDCPNLKGWWKRDIVDNSDVGTASTCQQHISLPSFPRLSRLIISNCCKLTCMPLFPYLEKGLSLINASLKPLQQTMAMTMNTAETSSLPSSSSLPLSKLKLLVLFEMQNVTTLPAYLQHVTTLQYLRISKCPSFMTLPEWLGNLTSLQNLDIEECPNLTSLPEGMRHLSSLQSLRIINCPHLEQRYQKEIGEDWPKIAHVPKYTNSLWG
uniref:Uncharacterized protein n=1 Tax=Fagus sylvatica TaxID=28930 RepID=A0A2N9FIE1_FAGSY